MECASRETPNLLMEPAFTRLRASHPFSGFAGMTSCADVVFIQVSGEREVLSKPGLNIIGGAQPRGPSEVAIDDDDDDGWAMLVDMPDIAGMLDMLDMLDLAGISDMLDIAGILDMDMDMSDIVVEEAIIFISEFIANLFSIPDIVIEELSRPSPGPA